MTGSHILVTGFEPFGGELVNPSQELAKTVDGRRVGAYTVRGLVLPVHHQHASATMARALADQDPRAVLHLGLAGGRARIALERVAVNVMDYPIPDNAGYCAAGEPCVPGGPPAYFATLPIRDMLRALVADGVPAYLSDTAGTYLCNQTLYGTLHAIERIGHRARAGFMHLPFLPAMVAASGLDQPSMDLAVMLRAVEVSLAVIGHALDAA
jgi:pyroglutamyl-peptidase